MQKTPTILQVLPALVSGGVERGTVEVADAIVKNGYKALVASAGGPMVGELEQVGATHIQLPLASKNPFVMYANIDKLANIISEYNVDIIHARSRAPAWSAYVAAQRTECPFITTFHNAYGAQNVFKRIYNMVMGEGDRVIAISSFVGAYAQRVYNVPSQKLRIIPRGVEISQFDPTKVENSRIEKLRRDWSLQPDVPVVLLPGRLTRWKGQLVMVEALAKLANHKVQCLFVGKPDADFKAEIDALAARLNVKSSLKIFDTCRDMPAALMLADVVVSPATRPEGFGRVIIEAQAMGKPVIATNHGGAAETIIPGQTGWLVPPGDADALASVLTEVLALTQQQRETLTARSIEHVRKNFTTETMIRATIGVYDEILRQAHKS